MVDCEEYWQRCLHDTIGTILVVVCRRMVKSRSGIPPLRIPPSEVSSYQLSVLKFTTSCGVNSDALRVLTIIYKLFDTLHLKRTAVHEGIMHYVRPCDHIYQLIPSLKISVQLHVHSTAVIYFVLL